MAKPMMKPPMKGMPMPMKGKAVPKPPPPPMPKAAAPVPMGGVGPGAMGGAMGAPPTMQAPQGYAFGTRNVPAPQPQPTPMPVPEKPIPGPGDTQTSGDWGGQNQGLRRQLGLGSTKAFASGSPDVSGPDVSKGGSDFAKPQPAEMGGTPGYDPQTGSYPLDGHFVAHLRAALGMGPKEQGFAGGTPNVGALPFNQQADVGQGPLDSLVSGSLGPLHVGAAAANPYPQAPAPAPVQDQTPDPNDFTARAAAQQIYTGADAMPQGQPGGSVPGRIVDYSRAVQQDPIVGSVLQTLMGVPQSFAVHDDGTVKKPPDPGMVDAAAKGTGATFEQANAMMNAHHYTQDEFVNAIRGMPIAVVEKLWNMQHYLNPQQMASKRYIGGVDQSVENAAQAYQAAQVDKNTPAGELEKYKQALEQAKGTQVDIGRRLTIPGTYIDPNLPQQ